MSLEVKVKRGEKSWNYFVIAYSALLAIVLTSISIVDISWEYKVLGIIFLALILFYLCFFNDWFRNKIVGIMSKSQEKNENH